MSPESFARWKNIYENENHVHPSPTFRVSIKTQACVSKWLQAAGAGIPCAAPSPPPAPLGRTFLIVLTQGSNACCSKPQISSAELPGAKLSITESSSSKPCCRMKCSLLPSFLRINTARAPSPSCPVSLSIFRSCQCLSLPPDVLRGL